MNWKLIEDFLKGRGVSRKFYVLFLASDVENKFLLPLQRKFA